LKQQETVLNSLSDDLKLVLGGGGCGGEKSSGSNIQQPTDQTGRSVTSIME